MINDESDILVLEGVSLVDDEHIKADPHERRRASFDDVRVPMVHLHRFLKELPLCPLVNEALRKDWCDELV